MKKKSTPRYVQYVSAISRVLWEGEKEKSKTKGYGILSIIEYYAEEGMHMDAVGSLAKLRSTTQLPSINGSITPRRLWSSFH